MNFYNNDCVLCSFDGDSNDATAAAQYGGGVALHSLKYNVNFMHEFNNISSLFAHCDNTYMGLCD